jgi:hypothetical protein
MTRLVRFLAVHATIGVLAGSAAATALLLADVGGLGSLVHDTASPGPALALLYGGFALTFGSLAMGSAVMLLPRDD